MVFRALVSAVVLLAVASSVSANDAELDRFQGKWEVIELVEDGRVIPPAAIEDWLPSGGRLEIVDNAIVSTSHESGKKEVKVFTIDATQSPKGIEINTRDKKEVTGIYRFEENQLVVCLVDAEDGLRPVDFSASAGSKRMLMTLRPVGRKATADTLKPEEKERPRQQPAAEQAGSAKLLNDPQLTKLLQGTVWRYKDAYGSLVLSLDADGRFSTVREAEEMRVFKKVFVKNLISSGTWNVDKGRLMLHILTSVDPARVNMKTGFSLRVVTDKDLIFVDSLGHVGQAVRVR